MICKQCTKYKRKQLKQYYKKLLTYKILLIAGSRPFDLLQLRQIFYTKSAYDGEPPKKAMYLDTLTTDLLRNWLKIKNGRIKDISIECDELDKQIKRIETLDSENSKEFSELTIGL